MPKPNGKIVILGILGLLIVVALGVFWWWEGGAFSLPRDAGVMEEERNAPVSRQFQTIELGEQAFEVVLSETPLQMQQGLSDRNSIGADGMLFVLPTPGRPLFWMNRMRFDLDFLWIADGQVLDMHQNVPAPTSGSRPAQVQPSDASEYVLEVPSGFIDQFGITIGTPFRLTGYPVDKAWEEE